MSEEYSEERTHHPLVEISPLDLETTPDPATIFDALDTPQEDKNPSQDDRAGRWQDLSISAIFSGKREALNKSRSRAIAIISGATLLGSCVGFALENTDASAKGENTLAIAALANTHRVTPITLETDFLTYVGNNVLLNGASGDITEGMPVMGSLTAKAHSVVTTATCKPYVLKGEDISTNTDFYNYVGLVGDSQGVCAAAAAQDANQIQYFHQPLKGIHGLCAPGYSSDYRIPCQEMNMLPGIKQDGELAASSIGLHADQYGTPSELVFNMGGQNRAGYYLDRAVISYKKGTTQNIRQLKQLVLRIAGRTEVTDKVWYK